LADGVTLPKSSSHDFLPSHLVREASGVSAGSRGKGTRRSAKGKGKGQTFKGGEKDHFAENMPASAWTSSSGQKGGYFGKGKPKGHVPFYDPSLFSPAQMASVFPYSGVDANAAMMTPVASSFQNAVGFVYPNFAAASPANFACADSGKGMMKGGQSTPFWWVGPQMQQMNSRPQAAPAIHHSNSWPNLSWGHLKDLWLKKNSNEIFAKFRTKTSKFVKNQQMFLQNRKNCVTRSNNASTQNDGNDPSQ
jgi:hypothetical protein